MSHYILPLVLILWGCSHETAGERQEKRDLVLESWKGHHTDELLKHHYFGNLPLKKIKHPENLETWIFRDQSRYQSAAYCQSLGGCTGIPFYQCDNAFSVKDNTILEFEQNGSCPPLATIAITPDRK